MCSGGNEIIIKVRAGCLCFCLQGKMEFEIVFNICILYTCGSSDTGVRV